MKSIKVLWVGLVFAALILAYYGFQVVERNQRINVVAAQCRAEAVSMVNAAKAAYPTLDCDKNQKGIPVKCLAGPPTDPANVLACDPETLAAAEASELKPIQAQLLTAAVKSKQFNRPARVALMIALLSAIPWLWYFILRRVSELGEAATGKPPKTW